MRTQLVSPKPVNTKHVPGTTKNIALYAIGYNRVRSGTIGYDRVRSGTVRSQRSAIQWGGRRYLVRHRHAPLVAKNNPINNILKLCLSTNMTSCSVKALKSVSAEFLFVGATYFRTNGDIFYFIYYLYLLLKKTHCLL